MASSGIGGLSIVVGDFIDIDKPLFIGVVNIFLIIISYVFLGKSNTYKTIVGSLVYPVFLKMTSSITGYIDLSGVDLLIKAVMGGIITGYGLGLVFKSGYTTGGTDIIEAILVKYLRLPMDKAIIIVDGVVVILSGIVFGIEHLIYALIFLLFQSIYSNQFMLGLKEDKILYINSLKSKEITEFLKDTYNYGTCGTTRNTIGLLPNKMLSGCHNGFVELISDYKKYCNEETPEGQNSTLDFNLFLNNQHNNKMVFPYKDLEKYRHQMEAYYKPNACF